MRIYYLLSLNFMFLVSKREEDQSSKIRLCSSLSSFIEDIILWSGVVLKHVIRSK